MRSGASSKFPDAQPSNIWVKLHPSATRVFRAFATLRYKTANVGDMADFVDWQHSVFGYQPSFFAKREKLWEQLVQRLDPERRLFVLEFGVAWGYSTDWWLRRLHGRDVIWHAFDRFTGNPRASRQLGAGAFDAGGKPPEIDDERVYWHVGDVEDTLGAVPLTGVRDAQWLVLFDLGFYEPTAFAWDMIGPYLEPGDFIYLDEPAQTDERRILNELILPSIECEPIGVTPIALALAVTGPRRSST